MAVSNLSQAIQNVESAIQSLTLNPRPNYSLDGRSYSWESLLAMLIDKHTTLLQAKQNADINENGNWEVITYPV